MSTARGTGTGADLPWGWHLRVNGASFQDAEGRRWRSVRDAFWVGHLGFPPSRVVVEQLELLSRVLEAKDARTWNGMESLGDLFDGDWMFMRFYKCWLSSVGLVQAKPPIDVVDAPLSELGRSVLSMLRLTREPQWMSVPLADVVAAVRSAGRTAADDQRELALRKFERGVPDLPCVFARESIPRSYLVTLTGVGTGARMPVKRVMWSQSFSDERARDDFFAWLAERVDRWEDWARMAHLSGAAALTQHLLGLLVTRFSND